MPFVQAPLLLVAIVAVAAATRSGRLHPLLALVPIAAVFGFAAGLDTGLVAKAFGAGFTQAIYSPGLVIVAAALVGGIADSSAAAAWLAQKFERSRWRGATGTAAGLGLIAGLASSPAMAFALLTPLLRAVSGAPQKREAGAIASALALSAGHGLLLFSPVSMAAASIFDASWGRVILYGLPLAIVLAAFGGGWARWLAARIASKPSLPDAASVLEKRGRWSAGVFVVATAIPLMMLIEQSLGSIPSEPLGGGHARELVLAAGRPLYLSSAALLIMLVGLWRISAKLLGDAAWVGRTLGNAAGLLLIVGAAGGLQRLCQETGMAELLGEQWLGWHIGGPLALFVPFLIAATIKTLQGSSLVAAIAAAGMVQPILVPLGLAGDSGRALAALAVGAGAMTVSHINDEFFWLVCGAADLRPTRGLGVFTVGTLAQGIIAIAALLAVAAVILR